MTNTKLNLQTVVAILFIFIFTGAFITTAFGQEKKERTKIVQLKIVEDENGEIKSIDTTYVFDGDMANGNQAMQKFQWFPNGDSIDVMVDLITDNLSFPNLDSLMQEISFEFKSCDSLGKRMMFIEAEIGKTMKELNEEMTNFEYLVFPSSQKDGDSLHEFIVKMKGCTSDSSRHIHHMNFDDKDGNVMIFSDDGQLNNFTHDTIIEKDGHKIIIKSTTDDNNKNIELITISEEEFEIDDSNGVITKTIKVVSEDGAYNVWVSDENDTFVVGDKTYEFKTIDSKDKESLEDAGVKTKKKDLEIDKLNFSPNPNNGKFNLSFDLKENKKLTIKIYDMNGGLVYSETLRDFEGHYNKEIDISDQGTGTFFLQIAQGLYDVIKKIIIQ